MIKLIRWYQRHLSPKLGDWCRFEPSCSQYAIDAIGKYGWRGYFRAMWRVLRCNPWSKGGYDPA